MIIIEWIKSSPLELSGHCSNITQSGIYLWALLRSIGRKINRNDSSCTQVFQHGPDSRDAIIPYMICYYTGEYWDISCNRFSHALDDISTHMSKALMCFSRCTTVSCDWALFQISIVWKYKLYLQIVLSGICIETKLVERKERKGESEKDDLNSINSISWLEIYYLI